MTGTLEIARRLFDLLVDYRERFRCMTFVALYVKSIRSAYLGHGEPAGFCELLFDVGIDHRGMTDVVLDALVEEMDDACIEMGAFRYLHSKTTKDPAKRRLIDPNTFYADRLREAGAAPSGQGDAVITPSRREVPLYTLAGVQDADVSTHYFETEDGLGLSLLRFQKGPADDAVMIVHGLTTSTDMFIMPEHENLVSYLLSHGFGDVWTLDFRMSNRHSYNLFAHRYNLDDVALFDFPPALAAMRREVGRPAHPRHLPLPGGGDVHDEPVRQGGGRDRQRHRQQRGAHPAHPRVVRDEAAVRAVHHGDGPRLPVPQPAVERGAQHVGEGRLQGRCPCSTGSATCRPATC